jgi:hypothetical protein
MPASDVQLPQKAKRKAEHAEYSPERGAPWENPDSRLFNAYAQICEWNEKEFRDTVVKRKMDAIFNASEAILGTLAEKGADDQPNILLLENAVYETSDALVKAYKSGSYDLNGSMQVYIDKLAGLAEAVPGLDVQGIISKCYKGFAV